MSGSENRSSHRDKTAFRESEAHYLAVPEVS
jgi:hypothetical protein